MGESKRIPVHLAPVGGLPGGRIHMQDRQGTIPGILAWGRGIPTPRPLCPARQARERARGGILVAAKHSRMDRHWVTIPMTAEGQAQQRPLLRAHPNPFSPCLRQHRRGTPMLDLTARWKWNEDFPAMARVAPQTHRPTSLRAGLGMYGRIAQKPTQITSAMVACISLTRYPPWCDELAC